MQTDQITAALDAANIRHTKEAVAMLAECNAESDWEAYRKAVQVAYDVGDGLVCATPFDGGDVANAKAFKAAHPHMPETKAMQAEIADLQAKLAEAQSHLPTSVPASRFTVPKGQTPLDEGLNHKYLDVFREGMAARDSGGASPYHGHSLEHCLHASGWVYRDIYARLEHSQQSGAAMSGPELRECPHDAWEQLHAFRRCADCGEYLPDETTRPQAPAMQVDGLVGELEVMIASSQGRDYVLGRDNVATLRRAITALRPSQGCRHNEDGWPCGLVAGRDRFIVANGLWDAFVDSLPTPPEKL